MKNLFCLLLLAISMSVNAQVGINADNSNPDPSAMLDVKSTDKGLLLPRMTQAQRNAIVNPANGLMIYQTDNTPGFYYNSGSSASPVWVITGSGLGWGLTGNSGTSAGTDFIGTTDDKPLRFRVNNTWAGEIHPTNGNIFLGLAVGQSNTSGGANIAIGEQSLSANTSGNFNTANGFYSLGLNTTGYDNSAFGSYALYNNTTGTSNTANGGAALYFNTTGSLNTANGESALYHNTNGNFNTASGIQALFSNTTGIYNNANGYRALYSNTTGYDNTASGSNALYSNTTGFQNTANGESALYSNTTGISNTATGHNALYFNTIGNYNTAIGESAGNMNVSGSSNVFIGNEAGYNETGSNKLYIANSSANPPLIYGDFSTGNVGIGTTSPLYKLDVQGTFPFIRVKASSGYAGLTLDKAASTDNGYVIHRQGGTDLWTEGTNGNNNFNIRNWTAGSDAFTLNIANNNARLSGKFGIKTDPSYDLHINSSDYTAGYITTPYPGCTAFEVIATATTAGTWGLYSYATTAGYAAYFSGNVYCSGTYLPSDEKLKENIQPLQNGLDKIMMLDVKTYNFKTAEFPELNLPNNMQNGFTAQNLESVFPELVRINPAKKEQPVEFKAVNYTGLIPVLTEAIQEQQKQLEAKDERIDSLQKQFDDLKALVLAIQQNH